MINILRPEVVNPGLDKLYLCSNDQSCYVNVYSIYSCLSKPLELFILHANA